MANQPQSIMPVMPPKPPANGNTGIVPPNPAAAPAPYRTTNAAINGVDPVRVQATPMAGYQPFIDSAYKQATSRLDPQFQQAENDFRQRMVSQGIPEGSQAYNDAYGNFSRAKNDAYASAENAAFGQGLAAQGQGFSQGAQQAQLAQALSQWNDQRALQSRGLDLQGQSINNQNSQFNASLANNKDQFGQTLGENQRQFDQNMGLSRDQFDTNTMMGLTQQDMQAFQLNQGANAQNYQMAMALMGMVPGAGPTQIDTYTPYNIQQNGAAQQAQIDQQQSNGFWGAIGSLGGAALSASTKPWIFSSRAMKEATGPLDPEQALAAVRSLPVDRWTYRGDPTPHVGTYAEDFNAALGLPVAPQIQIVDLFGALMASVQAIANRLDKMETARV